MRQHRAIVPLVLALGCGTRSSQRVAPSMQEQGSVSAARLAAALADTAAGTRVYLPTDVAAPATRIEPAERSPALPRPSAAEPTEARAGVRGVIDTIGIVERGTLVVLPGSDPREAAILFDEATRARWHPAQLADGRAVRQLFEWRSCRSGAGSCVHYVAPAITRVTPRVGAQ